MKAVICDICGGHITSKEHRYKTIIYLDNKKKKLDICWNCSYKIRAFCCQKKSN